ncbi:MFS transporter [bacterium]|nr:MFS transporter [bacterium]
MAHLLRRLDDLLQLLLLPRQLRRRPEGHGRRPRPRPHHHRHHRLRHQKVACSLGQFVNGQAGRPLRRRRFLLVGMLTSAAMNFLFGFSNLFWTLLFVWTVNGYMQSTGWPSCVKIMAEWFPTHLRGKAMGLMGTSYQFGHAATNYLTGWLVLSYGWRAAFVAPSAFLVVMAVVVMLVLRTRPQDAGLPPLQNNGALAPNGEPQEEQLSIAETLRGVLSNRNLWLVAIAFAGLDMIRYGFIDWSVRHLQEVMGESVDSSAVKNAVLPLGGAIGAVVAGWMTDRFFHSRRAPVVAVMLALLGVLTIFYHQVVEAGDATLVVIFLGMIGFLTYGPHVLMVGACPQDFGTRRMAASAAGFIDCMGYMGAALAGFGTAYLLKHFGWNAALYTWAGAAFVGAALMATLWNVKVSRE